MHVETSNQTCSGLVIGIDGANLRQGGGLTHVIELLRVANPYEFGISKIILLANGSTLAAVENRPWLVKINPKALDRGLLIRTFWQRFTLPKAALMLGCDLLFVPGSSEGGGFHPVVTMSRNMLPFEFAELRRFGWSLTTLRLLLLRLSQARSFHRADGLILLTQYAHDAVLRVTGPISGKTIIIPHGLNLRFISPPKVQRDILGFNDAQPFRLLYVSIIDQYKHQWHVVEAVAALRKQGLPIVLDLVGPSYPPALQRLDETLDRVDSNRRFVHYHGAVPFHELHHFYAQADLGLFASSCENMPNILLETMGSGLPIACSNRGPMPEVLGTAGVYFDPESVDDIARALRDLIKSPQLRTELAQASYERAQQYSWHRCAKTTFEFLATVAHQHQGSTCAAS